MINQYRLQFYLLELLGLIFSVAYILDATLSSTIFIYSLIVIATIVNNKLEALIIFLIFMMFVLDVLRVFNLAILKTIPITLNVIFLLVILRFARTKVVEKNGKFFRNFIFLLIPIVYIFKFTSAEFKLFIVEKLGYDQVGHLAITKALSYCSGFLPDCDSRLDILPMNYGHYPQQWHLLFTNFINLDSPEKSIESYLLVMLISLVLSIYMIRFALKSFQQKFVKINTKSMGPSSWYFNILESVMIIILIYITLMGYPNFLFAICLFISAIFISREGFKIFLPSLCLLFASASYTLLLPPSLLVVAFLLLLWVKQTKFNLKKLSILLFNIGIWGAFTLNVFLTVKSDQKATPSQITFLAFGSGRFNLVTIIVELLMLVTAICSFYLFKRYKQYLTCELVELFVINLIVLVCLYALNVFILYQGFNSSYYLTKFSYFSFCILIYSIFICIFMIHHLILPNNFKPLTTLKITTLLLFYLSTNSVLSQISIYHLPTNLAKDYINYNLYLPKLESQLKAIKISIETNKPIIFLSDNSGPDTQWVNSISGNWSAYLNNFLENNIDNEVEFRDIDFRRNTSGRILIYDSTQNKLIK